MKYYTTTLMLCLFALSACTTTYNTTLPDVTADAPIMLDVGNINVESVNSNSADKVSPLPLPATRLTALWMDGNLQASGDNGERMTILIDADTAVTQSPRSASFDLYTTTINITFRHYVPEQHLAIKESDMLIRTTREVDRDAHGLEREGFHAAITRHIAERLSTNVPAQLEKHFPDLLVVGGDKATINTAR